MKLSVSNLTKKYGGFTALDGVSFEMEEGIYAILGLNGAGKSTLIHLITDSLTRTGGTILFDDKEILKLGARYRDCIGYMPQEQAFYGDFTGRSYLYYMASLKGLKKKEAHIQIRQLLEQFNLEDAADKKMQAYSGGMRQRAVLAQALLGDPKILILDEPTAGLDPRERLNLKNYIKAISANKIVIYCTHVVSDIEHIADMVMLMKAGKILQMCTVSQLYAQIPKTDTQNIADLEQAFMYYMS